MPLEKEHQTDPAKQNQKKALTSFLKEVILQNIKIFCVKKYEIQKEISPVRSTKLNIVLLEASKCIDILKYIAVGEFYFENRQYEKCVPRRAKRVRKCR